jgi:type IV secretion system protein TrbG
MIRSLTLASILALATACANVPETAPIEPELFIAAAQVEDDEPHPVEIVETPTPLPLPGQMKPLHGGKQTVTHVYTSPPETIRKGTEEARIEPSVDGYVNAIQVFPYTEGALYRVYAAPGQVSDIALQPGETLVSVSAGDTVRWIVGDTSSGSGGTARAHVLIKPISAGLSTNLMIATDRRTYHLELESVSGAYMAALSWRYPADELLQLVTRNRAALARQETSVAAGVAIDRLDFDYFIEGDQPDWRPVRVFDDGRQVFIQMPEGLSTMEAPPLFVLGGSGESQLVNYRLKGNYYIVDYLFRAAELRLGETSQTVVRIRKRETRSGLVSLFGSKG